MNKSQFQLSTGVDRMWIMSYFLSTFPLWISFLPYPQSIDIFINLVIHTADFIHHLFDMFFEMTIFFGSFHDLGTGMHNRRMVTTIESRSDMRISVPGQFTAHIHGNLTREGNILGLFLPINSL